MTKSLDAFIRNAAGVAYEGGYSLLWLGLIVEIAVGVVLGIQSTGNPQAFDTNTYAVQARQFSAGDGSWLGAGAHNYLYPAFLALLHVLGFWGSDPAAGQTPPSTDGRLAVGIVQIALLYLTAFLLVAVLSRCLRVRSVVAGVVVCGIAILPATAWSGYWLSESMAASMIFLVIAAWVLTCYRVFLRPDAMSTTAILCGLGLVAGSAWMTRPALIWVPAVVGFLLGLMLLASALLLRTRHDVLSVRPPSSVQAVRLMAAFLVGAALALLPQLAFDSNFGHLLKLNLAGGQAHGSSIVWRYATNLSGCGSPSLAFTPLSSDMASLISGQIVAPHSPLFGLTSIAAHLVSGWDALPSPTYATSFSVMPWILVTLVSGFPCAAPLFASTWLATETRQLVGGSRLRDGSAVDMSRLAFAASVTGVVAFFGVTQLELLGTATEFRFNLAGWLSASACLVFLIASGWLTRNRLLAYAGISVAISAFVLIIGQMTLYYSAYWLQCR